MTVRVLLADDQALLRATFRLLIDSTPDLEVVAEAADGIEAVDKVRESRADIVVMDVRMPNLDGVEATRRICSDESLAGVRVVILTTFETQDVIIQALRAGASGFLGKDVEPATLLGAIRTVAAGESLLSPTATTAMIESFLAQTPSPPRQDRQLLDPLTDRELELTALVARGLSNEDIGQQLFISPATAKTHINRAMMKTGSRDRAQLVVYAYETGLVRPPSR